MVSQVFADVQFFDLAVLGEFFEDLLVKRVELFLPLATHVFRNVRFAVGTIRMEGGLGILPSVRVRVRVWGEG